MKMTDAGAQVVQVGGYAYRWTGDEPLEIGDQVVRPPNWLVNTESVGTVSALGTDYLGPLATLRRRVA